MTDHATTRRSALRQRMLRSLQMAFACAVLVCAVFWRWPSAFSAIEQVAYDSANQLRPNPPAAADLILVEIDDVSLDPSNLGRFPWSRAVYARILTGLREARAVGLDVLLLEPDEDDAAGEAELAAALRDLGVVVLPASIATDRVISSDAMERQEALARKLASARGVWTEPPSDPGRFQAPLAPFTAAAAGVGYANLVEDDDGKYRRLRPAHAAADGLIYPNFAAEVARVAEGASPEDYYAALPERLGTSGLPLDGGDLWIQYSGPAGTIERVSAYAVHSGEVPPERFAGKVVLVGATAAGLYDIRPAPYRGRGGQMFGVETNANIVNTLLGGLSLRGEPAASIHVSLLALGLFAGCLAWWRRVLAGTLAVVGLGLLVLAVYALCFWYGGLILAIGPRAVAIVLCLGVCLGDRLLVEARLRERMVDVFASYVSTEVAEHLASNPDDISLGGARREITVMFTDVRGFTTISESMDPQTLVEQMTEYFNTMVGAVFRFDGLVDKFIGDGIMALYGCFGEETEGHARKAVLSAAAMRELLPQLNARWAAEGRPTFRVGIGIHTGPAIVGNMGADRKWAFTAAGDTVNVASRIADLCKSHQDRWETTILVSEDVALECVELANMERMGKVEIRGRHESVGIHAVLSLRGREAVDADNQGAEEAEGRRAAEQHADPA